MMFPNANKERFECCGVWTPDGKYFLFSLAAKGLFEQRTVGVLCETKTLLGPTILQPTQLTSGPLSYWKPALSPHGKRLYVMGYHPRGELMRYDHKARRFMPYLSGISADGVNVSRDGKWMVFVPIKERTLWCSRTDGTQRLQLTSPPLRVGWPQLSPDQKWVVFIGSTAPMYLNFDPGAAYKLYRVQSTVVA